MPAPVYLDYNATTPPRPEVAAAMAEWLAECGNPSSVHAFGRAARRRVEDARAAVADLVGARPENVVFTSGGTEANNLALRGAGRRRVLVSAVEHDSVRDALPGAEEIPVAADGVVRPEAVEAALKRDSRPAIVAVMLANNETGIVQPVADIAEVAHRHGAVLHCDAVQAPGKIAVDLAALGADTLSLSAHKLGGPQGVGALVLAREDIQLDPLLRGGGQERRRRGGTENVPGIVGFGVAARIAHSLDDAARLAALRDRLEKAVADVADAVVIGAGMARLPNTTCLALAGLKSDLQVMALDLEGVMVSAGAACSSGKVAASRVLTAMGLPGELAAGVIRVSTGWRTTEADIDRFVEAWRTVAARIEAA